jgi:hypothetical protein
VQAQSQPEVYKLEAHCGRERSRGPRHARFSRDGVEEQEPAAEILSVLSEGTRSCPAPDDRGRVAQAFDLADITSTVGMVYTRLLKVGHPPGPPSQM